MKTQTMSLVVSLLLCSNSVLGARLHNQAVLAKAPQLNTLAQLKSKVTQQDGLDNSETGLEFGIGGDFGTLEDPLGEEGDFDYDDLDNEEQYFDGEFSEDDFGNDEVLADGSEAGRRLYKGQPGGPPRRGGYPPRRGPPQGGPPDPQCALCGTDGDCVPSSSTLPDAQIDQFLNNDEQEVQRYGQTEGYGELVGANAGANSNQGSTITRHPDVYQKKTGAQNSFAKKCGGEKTESSGCAKKVFTIQGQIEVCETSNAGACHKSVTAADATGNNDSEELTRVGDSCVVCPPQVCSCSSPGGQCPVCPQERRAAPQRRGTPY